MDILSILNEDLVFADLKCGTAEDVITFLSNRLFERGYLKEGFLKAILERESKYPTGLYLGDINVAIPHADIEYANKSGIAIATLNPPVKFRRMDNPNEEIDVSIVFLLVINDPKGYNKFLARLTKIFSNNSLMKKICDEKNPSMIVNLLKESLNEIMTNENITS